MRNYKRLIPFVITGILVAGATLSLGANSPEIEMTIVARGMAFYIDDDPQPNPRLALASDRRVRLTFINEDRGVLHDLLLGG